MNEETKQVDWRYFTECALSAIGNAGDFNGEHAFYDGIVDSVWENIAECNRWMVVSIRAFIPDIIHQWITTYGDEHESGFMEWFETEWREIVAPENEGFIKGWTEQHNEELPDDPDDAYWYWAATRGV